MSIPTPVALAIQRSPASHTRARAIGVAAAHALESLRTSVERLRAEAVRASDITTWPGHGVAPGEYTGVMRRGRLKASRVAAAASALLVRQEAALEAAFRASVSPGYDNEDDPEADIPRFEAEAARRIAELQLSGYRSHLAGSRSPPPLAEVQEAKVAPALSRQAEVPGQPASSSARTTQLRDIEQQVDALPSQIADLSHQPGDA